MRAALVTLFLLIVVANAAAQSPDLIEADRPGLADTGRVVGKGRFQFETGLQWEKRGGDKSEFVPVLFRIGLAERLEGRIEGNTFTSAIVDGIRHSGLATTSFGLGYVLQEAEAKHPSLGVIVRVLPAWGNGPFETQRVTGDIRLAADWDVSERFAINPNIGVGWYEGDLGTFLAGQFALTMSYAPTPRVSWFVDTGVQYPEVEEGTTSVIVDGGVACIPHENWQIDISAGTRVRGETPPRPFVAIGFAYRHK